MLPDVAQLYLQTMKRIDAADYYLFERDYFERLRDALGERGMLATVHIDGEAAAGAVFTEIDGLAQYHLSGSDARFRKQQPTKLLLHEMRQHGHRAGWRALHLGGGAGASEDSLFRFKAGFSSGRARFHTWRAVLDQDAYRRALGRRGQSGIDAADLGGDSKRTSGLVDVRIWETAHVPIRSLSRSTDDAGSADDAASQLDYPPELPS